MTRLSTCPPSPSSHRTPAPSPAADASRDVGTRGAAMVLLAAIVAALMVVAQQIVERWHDGHLLAAWVILWVVAFTAIALLAMPARRAIVALRNARRGWMAARAHAKREASRWDETLRDAQIMADTSRAMNGLALESVRRSE